MSYSQELFQSFCVPTKTGTLRGNIAQKDWFYGGSCARQTAKPLAFYKDKMSVKINNDVFFAEYGEPGDWFMVKKDGTPIKPIKYVEK